VRAIFEKLESGDIERAPTAAEIEDYWRTTLFGDLEEEDIVPTGDILTDVTAGLASLISAGPEREILIDPDDVLIDPDDVVSEPEEADADKPENIDGAPAVVATLVPVPAREATATPTPVSTPTPSPVDEPSPTVTPTPTVAPSPTASPSPTVTPRPTATPSPTPVVPPTIEVLSPTPRPTATPAALPTLIPTSPAAPSSGGGG